MQRPPIDREAAAAALAEGRKDVLRELIEFARDFDALASTLNEAPIADALAIPPERGDLIGGIRLLTSIGEGSSGVVFLGVTPPPLRKRVAVKWLAPRLDSAMGRRFTDECAALGRLGQVRNIATVHHAGLTSTGSPFIVMEPVLVNADRLGGRLDVLQEPPAVRTLLAYADEHALATAARCELFAQVCDGLQHAHGKLIIHRDLSPSNVLIGVIDGDVAPKIVDFGVSMLLAPASRADAAETAVGLRGDRVGTPICMSPEQTLSSDAVDVRSDVYSLTALLYWLLSGSPPILPLPDCGNGEAREALMHAIRTQVPQPASERVRQTTGNDSLARELRGDLDRLLAKGLSKDPGSRYPTAAALGDELRRFLRHEPLAAFPGTPWERARKFQRRNPLLVSGTALAILLQLAATGLAVVQGRRALVAERNALAAQAGLNEAAESVRALATGVAAPLETALSSMAMQTEERLEIAAAAVAVLEKQAARHPEDRLILMPLARALWKLGAAAGDPGVRNLGRRDRAIAALERGEEVAASIVERDRREPRPSAADRVAALALLAEIRLSRGRVDMSIGSDTALDWYDAARLDLEAALVVDPARFDLRMQLAYTAKLLCGLHAAISDIQVRRAGTAADPTWAAEELSRSRESSAQSIEVANRMEAFLGDEPPPLDLDVRELHASELQTRGEALLSSGQAKAAQRRLDEAAALCEALLAEAPERTTAIELLGSNRRYAANLADVLGDSDRAMSSRSQAIAAFERALAVDPTRIGALRAIALVWREAAATAERRDDHGQAITCGAAHLDVSRRLRTADAEDLTWAAELATALSHQSARLERRSTDASVDPWERKSARAAALAMVGELLEIVELLGTSSDEQATALREECLARRARLDTESDAASAPP